ncbi:MAG: energy transducer TonB, partial [Burkholderiales bacterium]
PPLKPAPAPVRAPAQQPAPAERAPDPPPVNAARAEPALTAAPSAPQETPRASDRVGVANAERRADAAVAPPAVSAPHLDATYLRNTLAYPTASVRNNEQGTVLVKVLVARDGTVSRAELEKSSGWPNLDMAAVRSIRTWRFVPARRGDEAIEKEYIVPAVFRLENVRR